MDLGGGAVAPRRLLIVGDPALSRGLMRMVLTRLGYVVTCVASGQEALTVLSHSQFALALVAVHLPDLAGLTFARRLRQARGTIGAMPIIMFGDAWDPEPILAACRDAGLQGYLPKPISIARLVTSIHEHIHRVSNTPGAAPTMIAPPPVDLERLTSFTDGDLQLERELTSLFLATASVYLDEMRAALDHGAGVSWAKAAHALKGASANIGAVELARLAGEAEEAEPASEHLARLDAALGAVRRFVEARAAAPGTDVRMLRTG